MMRLNKRFCLVVLILIHVGILFTGCSSKKEVQTHKKNIMANTLLKDNINKFQTVGIQPIITNGELQNYQINGWISDNTIIYTHTQNKESTVYQYDLYSGKSGQLYKTKEYIVSVNIGPLQENILIHTSPTTYSARLTVLDVLGKKESSVLIDSYEISVDWNETTPSQILVTSFYEDWSYETYLYDISNNELTLVNLPHPIGKWFKDELYYLDWDQNSPSLIAPLKRYSFETFNSSNFLENIFMYETYIDGMLAIQINKDFLDRGRYLFIQEDLTTSSIEVPLLTRFSDWYIPPFEWLHQTGSFLYFVPYHSGEADRYKDGFKLMMYLFNDKSTKTIMENVEPAPVSCSPSNELCLYGYQFEKIINLATKKVQTIIK